MVVMSNDVNHAEGAKKREAYDFLVKDGMEYEDLKETLNVTRNFLTRMALDTNLVPSISAEGQKFNRNLLYHCLKENKEHLAKIDRRRERLRQQELERQKYTPDDDWSVR